MVGETVVHLTSETWRDLHEWWHVRGSAAGQIVARIDLRKIEREMKLVDVLPMKFDSFYVSLLSEKYKTGKMNFIRAFFVIIRIKIKLFSFLIE